MSKVTSQYLKVPPPKNAEFWSPARIGHVRELATTGVATTRWAEPVAGPRALDALTFKALADAPRDPPDARDIDVQIDLARGRIPLFRPLYLGDMSFGSLSGTPNVALARAADATGALAGTGEGGLHPDVASATRITVQWASARFGVTPATLDRGLAVVIKVGQGAKPGVGGHLPASKVTDVIRRTRRIPAGRDAISPAPHHDIYSIEDLGQRIAALKVLTGKPVFVKVAATNYAPFVACGVARMNADGIILDGAGAGTGASPSVMKDHVGLPIEHAVAGVHRRLQAEGLRDGFSVIAAGAIASPLDAARLTALGADCVSIGTASLIAMGCVMVHRCHVGTCPTILTSAAEDDPKRTLDVDWLVKLQTAFVKGWTKELAAIVQTLGLDTLPDLVGRTDLLTTRAPLAPDTAALFGVETPARPMERHRAAEPGALPPRLTAWSRELAGTTGKHAGEALVSSMGSTAAPFAEAARRPLDHLRIDGAQVTRPAIDSYREPVTLHHRLANGVRLAAPLIVPVPSPRPDLAPAVAGAAHALGLLAASEEPWPLDAEMYRARLLPPLSAVAAPNAPSRVLRLPASEKALERAPRNRADVDAVLLDEDLPVRGERVPLEVAVAELDRRATVASPDILASASTLAGAGDAFKLVALGANGVALPGVVTHALDGVTDPVAARRAVEHLHLGLMRELRLLLGAAGCSALPSLIGNTELLRAIDLDSGTRARLGVKAAGWG